MKLVQNLEIAWQEYDGEAVLVDPDNTVCMVLNPAATCVWKACKAETDIQDVVQCLRNEFEASKDQIQQDVEEIVQEFISKNILKEV